jgi:hypothetical protein
MDAYQPALPGMTPPIAGRRREPRQRKGESWQSYAFRHATWRRATFRELIPEEKAERIRLHEEAREQHFRHTEVWCYQQVELAKRNLFSNGKTLACPSPVFFLFGQYGIPGMQAQYISQATLNYLTERGYIVTGNQIPPPRRKPGKMRVSFGPCLGGL